MLDYGASHNLMPLLVMEHLGLEITKPYKDLYSFESKRVKCLGMIKDLVVNLTQIPVKSVVMDIVVVDIPLRFQGKELYQARSDLCHYSNFWR